MPASFPVRQLWAMMYRRLGKEYNHVDRRAEGCRGAISLQRRPLLLLLLLLLLPQSNNLNREELWVLLLLMNIEFTYILACRHLI